MKAENFGSNGFSAMNLRESFFLFSKSANLVCFNSRKLYGVSDSAIYRWIYKFSTINQQGIRVVEMKESSVHKLKELEQKIKDLEQAVGQKQIMIDYLEKMIDIAKEDLDIVIKKITAPNDRVVQAALKRKRYTMNAVYKAIGISRQGVIKYEQRQNIFDKKVRVLMLEAQELHREHPGCGVEKMYYALKPQFLGRDRFIELFMELGFRLEHRKNYRRTTFSVATNYPNLIKRMKVSAPSTIWQSDIT